MALFYWLNYLVVHPKALAKKDSILGEPGENHEVFIDKMFMVLLIVLVKQKQWKSELTAWITRHVDSNGQVSEELFIVLPSTRYSAQASIEVAIESRLYPPSNANTIFP